MEVGRDEFSDLAGFGLPVPIVGAERRPEVASLLAHLAVDRGLAASTHRQARSALLVFCSKVLGQELPSMSEIGQPAVKRRLPVVLTLDELGRLFGHGCVQSAGCASVRCTLNPTFSTDSLSPAKAALRAPAAFAGPRP